MTDIVERLETLTAADSRWCDPDCARFAAAASMVMADAADEIKRLRGRATADAGDIPERLRARACPAGEPWTGDDPASDHGHTDCWLFHMAADEIERLRQWQAEALNVIDGWERTWVAAGKPGKLGRPKSEGVLAEIEHLRAELTAHAQKAANYRTRRRKQITELLRRNSGLRAEAEAMTEKLAQARRGLHASQGEWIRIDARLQPILDAWTVVDEYELGVIRREWPTLAAALDNATTTKGDNQDD